jgi:hypothetical protein
MTSPFYPQLDKKAVMELFDLTFIAKHGNVIFPGNSLASRKRIFPLGLPSRP